jgi:hypothetical protein
MFDSFASSTTSSQQNTIAFRSLIEARSIELFKLCDIENKGFINKKDIQRMCSFEPNMTPDMLEEVFETLDADHNGFLTLEEFSYGFTSLFQPNEYSESNSNDANEYNSQISIEHDEEEDENAFKETIDALGAHDLINNRYIINKCLFNFISNFLTKHLQ